MLGCTAKKQRYTQPLPLSCLDLKAPLPIHIGKMRSEESKAWTGRV